MLQKLSIMLLSSTQKSLIMHFKLPKILLPPLANNAILLLVVDHLHCCFSSK